MYQQRTFWERSQEKKSHSQSKQQRRNKHKQVNKQNPQNKINEKGKITATSKMLRNRGQKLRHYQVGRPDLWIGKISVVHGWMTEIGLWATQSSLKSQLYSSQDLNKLYEYSYGGINDHNYLKQKRNAEGLLIPDFELYYGNLLINHTIGPSQNSHEGQWDRITYRATA